MSDARTWRTVVVTGASGGIGRAIARAFAPRADAVALLARDREGLAGAVREVEDAGAKALAITADVAEYANVEAAANDIEKTLGPIDVWVNNAMTTVFGFFADTGAEEFERATAVTYLGAVWGTKAALNRMRRRNRGQIIEVGSALAYRGIPLQAAYCGAKHAELGFVESLRTELRHAGSGVRVQMVQLPGVNTPQFDHCRSKMPRRAMPVPPIYQPEVAARAVLWLADHPRRRELWVGAPTPLTILANKVVPGLVEWYLARTGISSQQTEEPERSGRPDNLFDPIAEDAGAHGRFDARAHDASPQLWLATHRPALAAAGLGAILGVLLRRNARRSESRRSRHER